VLEGLHNKGIEPCRRGTGVLRCIMCTVNSRFKRTRFVGQKDIRSFRVDIDRHYLSRMICCENSYTLEMCMKLKLCAKMP